MMHAYRRTSRFRHTRTGTDTYIPPYSILHRSSATSSSSSSASASDSGISKIPNRNRRGPNSAVQSVNLCHRLAARSSTAPALPQSHSSPPKLDFQAGTSHLEGDLRIKSNVTYSTSPHMREPRIPQYMPFRAHRRFNKGFPRLSSSAKGSSLEMKEELRRGHVGVPGGTVTKETLPIIIIKEDNSILPLADRLSVPSLSARIAQEDTESHHVNATTEQHAISHLAGSPSSEHLLGQLDIVTFGGEGSSLEEGELEEGDHLVEIEEKEGEFQPEFNKENRRVLVRNLESGTTPEDVAAVFERFGQVTRAYEYATSSTTFNKACLQECDDVLVEFADSSSAAQAIEAMNGIMADGRIISVSFA